MPRIGWKPYINVKNSSCISSEKYALRVPGDWLNLQGLLGLCQELILGRSEPFVSAAGGGPVLTHHGGCWSQLGSVLGRP